MPDKKLSDFLTELAQNPDLLKRYLRSKHDRDAVVDESGLAQGKKQPLKDNNFKKVREIVVEENPDSEVYLVPMGQQVTIM